MFYYAQNILNMYVAVIIIISSSIQPLGQFGQEPEPSQATGMALVHCILGKFLGVVCHCFPPVAVYNLIDSLLSNYTTQNP